MNGHITRLHDGYGFIVGADRRSYFFRATSLAAGAYRFGALRPGAAVTFTPTEAERGPRAEDVCEAP